MGQRDVVLFLLIDALGWEWIRNSNFLKDIGVCRQPVKTIFGFSSAAIPTILTGKYPDEHGRWNLLYYSPETSPFRWTRPLRILPRPLLENRVSRKLINIISKRLAKADGYFSGYVSTDKLCLFDICEKYNIYKPGGIAGSETIIDYLAEKKVAHQVYSYHDYTDIETLEALKKDVGQGESEVYFAYLPELDAYLHANSDKPELVAQKISWYEGHIREILSIATDTYQNVRWFVFSDHGMTPITSHFDLIGFIKEKNIDLEEKDCVAVFDSTMARFWVKKPEMRKAIVLALADCPAGKVLSESELAGLRVSFEDDRYGNIIFLMNPGTLIYPNLFGSHHPSGMHGFHPDDRHSNGIFISNVGDHDPHEIIDFYQIMRTEIARVRS